MKSSLGGGWFHHPMDTTKGFTDRMFEGKIKAGKPPRPRKRGMREPAPTQLYQAILKEHRAVERGHRDMLAHARRAGQLLLRAKVQMRHGTFMKWIARWNQFSHATANLYMRIAKGWDRLETNSERIMNSSLLEVDEWLRKEEKKTHQQPKKQTSREKKWRKEYNKLYDRFDDFDQFLCPGTPEYERLWMMATMDQFEIEQMLAACQALRRRIDSLIEDLKGYLDKIFEWERLDALSGVHDQEIAAVAEAAADCALDEPTPAATEEVVSAGTSRPEALASSM